MCGIATDRLEVTQIRADDRYLYLDVAHRGGAPSDAHPGEPPTAFLRVDGCEASAPRLSGTVWRDWDAPSSLTLPIGALPDGELDITVAAFGARRTVSLRKVGGTLTDLPLTERAGVRRIPALPLLGLPPALALPEPSCAKGGA